MESLVRLLAAGCVAVLLLATAKCDVQSFKQHMEAEKKMKLMMDPSANYKYFKHEADITYVMPEFYEKFGHEEERFKRLTTTSVARWENGIVPYVMSESYPAHDRNVVLMALSHYEEKTCLRFVERTNETAYLIFTAGAGCRSFVGKQSRQPQGVSLPRSCTNEFHMVLHQIGHSIGLLHEHTRPDRDDYVDVIYDNIYAGFRREFEIEDAEIADTLGVGYDYNSVMHYKPDAFGNDLTPGITIVADNPGIPVGPGNALSKLDVLKINRLYECPDVHPPRSTVYVPPSEPGLPPLTKACGGRFDGDRNGVITSPGFPEYRTNQDCKWQLRVPIGFQIRFDFKTVDLHQSPGCQDGYFEIYENPDCTGFLITRRRLCSAPYHPFYSFSNKACVRYRSENPSNANDLTGIEITFTADDENECFFSAICEHQCVNTPGGYYCTCPEGYFLAPDGRRCFDVNECAMEGHMCDYKCENFGGHHECTCPDGSTQVGDSCALTITHPRITLNECLHNNGGCEHLCMDTEESYFCTCRDRYLLQADGHSCEILQNATPALLDTTPQTLRPPTAN